MTTPNNGNDFQTTQESLLQKLVAQNEQTNLLREQELAQKKLELEQQAELIKATIAKAAAEELAAQELRRANEINQEQIEVMKNLLAKVEEWVNYFKSGKAQNAFELVQQKLDALAHVIEAMIFSRPPDDTTNVLLGIIRGDPAPQPQNRGQTGPLRHRSNSSLIRKMLDENQLTDALLQCQSIQDNFSTIKSDLPHEVSSRISGSDKLIVQVRELVRSCVQFNLVGELVRVVSYYEGNSLAFAEVKKLVGE